MSTIELAPYVPHDEGAPRLHAPSVYGASPGKLLFYAIPATGARPLRFSISGELPGWLTIDAQTGIISGTPELGKTGGTHEEGAAACPRGQCSYALTVRAENALGADEKKIKLIIAPDGAGLTPMMGWCSWNAFGSHVSQQKVEETAKFMVSTGLSSYGYQYVNTDSAWQGDYGGVHEAIMNNAKFPDMRAMTDLIHSLGLKAGIYSTPMQKAWGGGELPGCTRGPLDCRWPESYFGIGRVRCEQACVDQWTEWGFDYLKYDWVPTDPDNAEIMKECLRKSSREFLFCVTTRAVLEHAAYWRENCSHWRDNGDSDDTWENVIDNRFKSDFWAEHIRPGHFFDMDMLECGCLSGQMSGIQRRSRLSENEQLAAYSIRALFPSPIQLSCDLGKLTAFDMAMFCNEEIIAVNQDALAIGATCIREERENELGRAERSHRRAYLRPLEDGSLAAGLFNLSGQQEDVTLPLDGKYSVRDLWAKKELGECSGPLTLSIQPHAVRMLKLRPVQAS